VALKEKVEPAPHLSRQDCGCCCRKKKVETAPQLCRQDCGCCTAGKRRWRPLHNSAGRTVAAALQEKEGGCPLEYRKTPLLALHAVVAWSLVFSLVWLLTIGCVFL